MSVEDSKVLISLFMSIDGGNGDSVLILDSVAKTSEIRIIPDFAISALSQLNLGGPHFLVLMQPYEVVVALSVALFEEDLVALSIFVGNYIK